MQSFEVEVKSLLGSKEKADELRKSLERVDPGCRLETQNSQLNHYFEPSNELSSGEALAALAKVVAPHISGVAEIKLDDFAERAKEFSVRTRDKDGNVYFVVKASVGSDSSENGIARMEIEEKVEVSLEELDKAILSAGFRYQAKWSRQREEYICKGINVTLDKNAGYGWLAEFERVVDEQEKIAPAKDEINHLMQELGVEELPQERLERMFSFYNKNWQEYYGTEKIFTIE